MRAHLIQEHQVNSLIIEQLNKLNYFDTEGKTQRELIHKLATLRAMEVKAVNPESGWF